MTGAVDTAQCSLVLAHEHFFIDLRGQAAARAATRKIRDTDRPALMVDPYFLQDNLQLDDLETAAEECVRLNAAGCNTVVDCSTSEIGRDPERLRALAVRTHMNIVMGCGHYTGDTHGEDFRRATEAEAAAQLRAEIQTGIRGIRPGIIGEIGTSRDLQAGEIKALRVAAEVQKETNLALQIHIYPWSQNGLKVLDLLFAQGVDPRRIVICHSDVAPDREYIFALLRRGVYVEFDNFGKEFTPPAGGFADGRFAPDSERVRLGAEIIHAGWGTQLLLTNDLCLKCMLTRFGGRGYAHIFEDIVPAFAEYGIETEFLREVILHRNPLAMLSGAAD